MAGYKVSAQDIKDLQKWGQENEVIRKFIEKGLQPSLYRTGYYSPGGANWAWQIGIAKIGPSYYELLTRFGAVEGGRLIYMPKYNLNGSNKK